MEVKTYTTVDPKFVYKKIKIKVLHYIQLDFIRQCLGFSKDVYACDILLMFPFYHALFVFFMFLYLSFIYYF